MLYQKKKTNIYKCFQLTSSNTTTIAKKKYIFPSLFTMICIIQHPHRSDHFSPQDTLPG